MAEIILQNTVSHTAIETVNSPNEVIYQQTHLKKILIVLSSHSLRCHNIGPEPSNRGFLQFQVSTNVTAVVITFVTAVASASETSVLSAVQLLWINIIMDTFAALALATDPASESLLDRKPDKKTAPLFSVEMYKQILFQSTYQIIITLIFHFLGLRILGYRTSSDNTVNTKQNSIVQTVVFNAFVFAQIFNSVNCRRLDRKLNVFEGILRNWYFVAITFIGMSTIASFTSLNRLWVPDRNCWANCNRFHWWCCFPSYSHRRS